MAVSIAEALNNELLPYVLLALAVSILLHVLLTPAPAATAEKELGAKAAEEEDEEDAARAFTLEQLRKFNGVVPEGGPKFDLDLGKIHICLKSVVYDVTSGADFYGPGGGYHCFAGRDASRCLAKLSFEESDLSTGSKIDDLPASQLDQLQEWVEKYEMKGYRKAGRLVVPPACPAEPMSLERLAEVNGTGPVPEGRVDPPCYVGCKGKVFDVSFGGFDMYKPGASYHKFAGKDVSRALAKMSFEPDDIASRDLSDLTPEQSKVLDDWCDKFENKKKYPVVATLAPFEK